MAGNSLSVDQLRSMMLVFDETFFNTSFAAISDEFVESFATELDMQPPTKGHNAENGDANSDEEEVVFMDLREASPSFGLKSNEHFRFLLASTLITLLNDRFNSQRRLQKPENKVADHGFFKPLQRLIALYLVYNLYKHKPIGHHPFLPHFMQIIEGCPIENKIEKEDDDDDDDAVEKIKSMEELIFPESANETELSRRFTPLCDKIEAEFIVKLLFNRDIDKISKMSAIEFTKVYSDKLINNELEKWPEFTQIQQLISSRHNKNFTYSPLKALGLNPILRDYDLDLDLKLAPFAADDNIISHLHINAEFENYATFDPEIVRPPPPFMIHFEQSEMRWMFLNESPHLIWDKEEYKREGVMNGIDECKEEDDLIQRAMKRELDENEKESLMAQINEYYASNKNLTGFVAVQCLEHLAVYNPDVGIQIFMILKGNHKELNAYFNALCSLNVSDVETAQNSMNLMKQIAEKIKIPKKYIVQFISHCIKTCEETKEPFHQTRLVRYICIFVQKLINQQIISIKDGAVEIEAFCLEFSRISEATKLYQLLKQQNISNDTDSKTNENDKNDIP